MQFVQRKSPVSVLPAYLHTVFSSDGAIIQNNKNKGLTFLQNGQVDLENTITVLSLMFCSIKSLMGAILLGTSGEGVLARFRFETTVPMVEKQDIIGTNNVYIWSHWKI